MRIGVKVSFMMMPDNLYFVPIRICPNQQVVFRKGAFGQDNSEGMLTVE